ncbi:MAG: hypothetical protein JNN06_04695 [Gemmobacter sp.]|uniref:hypothetical protein n=1 Tax=Gemmobacter sp. TaxID=1898957 RepID=UPI001A4599A8|nr:hypothetical protein [Gemmobacter sp.]MBL8561557.1 hypothetical protein [Gemmobacter sp.]
MLRRLALALLLAAAPAIAPTGAVAEPFRAAVARQVAACWSIDALSPEAQATTVTLGVDLGADAVPQADAITLIASDAPAPAAQEAFEAARRAVLRCGASGLPLPPDQHEAWRHMELTFTAGAYIS